MSNFDWTPIFTAASAIAGSGFTQYLGIRAQRRSQSAQWQQDAQVETARWERDRDEERERRSREAGELTLERSIELLGLLTPLTAFPPDLMSDEIQDVKGQVLNSVYLVRHEKVRRAVYMALRGMLTSMVCPPPELRDGEAWRESQRLADAMVDLVAAWLRGDDFRDLYERIEQAHDLGEDRFKALQEDQRRRTQPE